MVDRVEAEAGRTEQVLVVAVAQEVEAGEMVEWFACVR